MIIFAVCSLLSIPPKINKRVTPDGDLGDLTKDENITFLCDNLYGPDRN